MKVRYVGLNFKLIFFNFNFYQPYWNNFTSFDYLCTDFLDLRKGLKFRRGLLIKSFISEKKLR